MELRHLIYFEAVARHQHVSHAAAELAIAQPAVSKQIHDLERELGGVVLFERVGRNIRLTEAGQALLEHVRIILAQVEAARAEIRERVGLQSGRASIGAPPTVGVQLLPRILAAFNQRYPMIVVAPDHPLAARESVALSALANESFLLYPRGYGMRDKTLEACQQAGFTPRVVLDGGEMDMVLRLAEAGLGIALMPRLALDSAPNLVALHVSDQALRRTMALVSREDRALAPAARALRAFLESRLVPT